MAPILPQQILAETYNCLYVSKDLRRLESMLSNDRFEARTYWYDANGKEISAWIQTNKRDYLFILSKYLATTAMTIKEDPEFHLHTQTGPSFFVCSKQQPMHCSSLDLISEISLSLIREGDTIKINCITNRIIRDFQL